MLLFFRDNAYFTMHYSIAIKNLSMKKLLSLLLIMPFSIIYSQVQPEWRAVFQQGFVTGNEATAIVTDNNGNVLVTGVCSATGTQQNYATLKYSATGALIWSSIYNGPANSFDVPNSIEVDALGNVYVTGYSFNSSADADIVTVKYNTLGQQQWEARYNNIPGGFDGGRSVAVDNAGNVYVTGYAASSTVTDVVVIKYNSAGVQQWISFYNGTANNLDEGVKIGVDNSGNVYAGGNSYSGGYSDYVVVKYNSAGGFQWAERYNGPGSRNDLLNSMKVDGAGNVYVTGSSEGVSTFEDFATIKYNSVGQQQWVMRFNGVLSTTDIARSLVIDNSSNVYVAGVTSRTAGNSDAMTIKYNSAGAQQWAVHFDDSSRNDHANTVDVDRNGNVFVGGFSYFRALVLKYSPAGALQWRGGIFSTATTTEVNVLAVDTLGGIFTSGYQIGAFSEIQTMRFSEAIPAPPQLFMPGNDTVYSSSAVFARHRWFKSIGASSYNFQRALDSGFTNLINDTTFTDTTLVTVGLLSNTRYWWRVRANNFFGTSPWSQLWSYSTAVIGIEPISSTVPREFALYNNYPNPFNPVTKIRFDVPSVKNSAGAVNVKLTIYDILGKEIAAPVNEALPPGEFEIQWDASVLPSGIYFYKLAAGDFVNTKRMVLVK